MDPFVPQGTWWYSQAPLGEPIDFSLLGATRDFDGQYGVRAQEVRQRYPYYHSSFWWSPDKPRTVNPKPGNPK